MPPLKTLMGEITGLERGGCLILLLPACPELSTREQCKGPLLAVVPGPRTNFGDLFLECFQCCHHNCFIMRVFKIFKNTVSLMIGRFEIMIHANTQKAADLCNFSKAVLIIVLPGLCYQHWSYSTELIVECYFHYRDIDISPPTESSYSLFCKQHLRQ